MIAKIQAFIIRAQAYAKLIASIVGGALIIGAQFIPSEYVPLVTGILAAITAFSVYKFENVAQPAE